MTLFAGISMAISQWAILYLFVFSHELGHCLAPRLLGTRKVDRAFVGMGKPVFTLRIGHIQVQIRSFPLPVGRSWQSEPSRLTKSQRLLTTLGGPLANLMISILAYSILNLSLHGEWLGTSLTPAVQSAMKADFAILIDQSKAVKALVMLRESMRPGEWYLYATYVLNSMIFTYSMLPINLPLRRDGKRFMSDGARLIRTLFSR